MTITRERAIKLQTEYFKDHIATQIGNSPEDEIEFRSPETFHCRIHFLLKGGLLIVYGDLGHAMYRWDTSAETSKFTLKTIAQMDIGYFHGKCVCADTGDRYHIWDSDVAKGAFREWLQERIGDLSEYNQIKIENIDFSDCYSLDETLNNERIRIKEETGSQIYYDPCELYNIGKSRHIRCDLQLIGLKLAIDQLKKKKKTRRQ